MIHLSAMSDDCPINVIGILSQNTGLENKSVVITVFWEVMPCTMAEIYQ